MLTKISKFQNYKSICLLFVGRPNQNSANRNFEILKFWMDRQESKNKLWNFEILLFQNLILNFWKFWKFKIKFWKFWNFEKSKISAYIILKFWISDQMSMPAPRHIGSKFQNFKIILSTFCSKSKITASEILNFWNFDRKFKISKFRDTNFAPKAKFRLVKFWNFEMLIRYPSRRHYLLEQNFKISKFQRRNFAPKAKFRHPKFWNFR